MRRGVSVAVFVAVLLFGVAPLVTGRKNLAGPQQKVEGAEVKIEDFSFGPQELKVSVGTTVTWTNRDDIPSSAQTRFSSQKCSIPMTSFPSSLTKRELIRTFARFIPR